MTTIDWVVFFAFLAWVVGDGIRRARGTKDLEGYFAGDRKVPWWAAGLSVMATQASAITVIGTTSQGHEGGMEFVQLYFGLPIAMVVLCVFFVPFYRRTPILTAYEYLEGRFGPLTRTLASLIFLVSRCMAFGVVLYAPAVVLSAMTGVDQTVTVITLGVVTTVYTMIGGIRAVIWTDVKQMLVIIAGLFVVFGVLLSKILPSIGLFDGLEVLGAAGKLEVVETTPDTTDLVPRVRGGDGAKSFWDDKYNLWSGVIGGLFLHLAYFGCDQSQVQRILTNADANESRKALLMSAFAKVPMQAFVLFLGVLMFLFHVVDEERLLYRPDDQVRAATPELAAAVEPLEARFDAAQDERRRLALALAALPDGPESDVDTLRAFQASVREVASIRAEARVAVAVNGAPSKDTNYIFPAFILEHLPPILLGLVIAAIFAAAMSSADSALNSLTASAVVDIYKRWFKPDASEAHALRASRFLTVALGTFATLFALSVAGTGSVIELINKVGSFFYGSLLGVFALGILWKRAGRYAGIAGLAAGMISVLVVDRVLEVQYLWYNVIGAVAVVAVGILVSAFDAPRREAST